MVLCCRIQKTMLLESFEKTNAVLKQKAKVKIINIARYRRTTSNALDMLVSISLKLLLKSSLSMVGQ